jgi:hypothetical protein
LVVALTDGVTVRVLDAVAEAGGETVDEDDPVVRELLYV